MIQLLLQLSLLSLPFTQALTLNLAFPLKIYELMLILALGLSLSRMRMQSPPGAKRELRILVLFWCLTFAIFLIRTVFPAEGLSTDGFISRFGPIGDGVTKLVYLLMTITGFMLFSCYAYSHKEKFIRIWLIGAVIASVYSWYLLASAMTSLPTILLPGMGENPQVMTVGDFAWIRCGTFGEGNFLGLYLLLSTCIAVYAGRNLLAVFLATTILVTASTINLVAALLFALLLVQGSIRKRPSPVRILSALFVILLLIITVDDISKTSFVRKMGTEKLVTEGASAYFRIMQSRAALRMFADHPLIGVGISRFGYHYYFYAPEDPTLTWIDPPKRIPNNVYLELLSETGIAGFLVFACFMMRMYSRLKRNDLYILRYGFYTLIFVFLAYPTFSIMFIWAFLALALGISARLEQGETSSGSRLTLPSEITSVPEH